ncbi:GNAT family N-acetyltransferase [Halorubrum sp. CBA1125]|uniref:GNAT family N-acetyltransferase n=1 Tax=Halorubrum sp. CBA1125 TaxID=2668072 RepID=UPI0012E75815|nr:GNAT family N-acetyltransferase [Halorubrum sp. CBA1125]MUW13714.1 GNAT family N-acetyltransferase [Halorubrum sp. CBA1125]
MELAQRVSIENRDRKDIYEYVERRGSVPAETVRRELGFDEEAFGHHLAVLRRDGYIRQVDDDLEIAFDTDAATVHEHDDTRFAIRTARQSDLSGLVGIIRQVAKEGTYIEAETVADLLDYEEILLRDNDAESRMFFVATVEEQVVGWVHLDLPETEKLRHTAKLTLGVLEEYRGRGIGETLLEKGSTWAHENGFEKLYNSVPATNEEAQSFLKSHGWFTEATREDHYRIDGEYVDEVMLARSL